MLVLCFFQCVFVRAHMGVGLYDYMCVRVCVREYVFSWFVRDWANAQRTRTDFLS